MIRISRCDFDITKSVPDLQPLAKFFPCGRRSRGTHGPSPQGPKGRKFDGNLGPTHRGDRGPGAHFPGGGGGKGSNSLPRTTRIAVWEIFSGGLRGLGNFFRESSRYGKIILDQKTLVVRARAPPHRRYAKDQNFLTTTNLF